MSMDSRTTTEHLVRIRHRAGRRRVCVSWNQPPWIIEVAERRDQVQVSLPATRTKSLGDDTQLSEPQSVEITPATEIAEGVLAVLAHYLGKPNPFLLSVDLIDTPPAEPLAPDISATCRALPDMLPSGPMRPVVMARRHDEGLDLILNFELYRLDHSVAEALHVALTACLAPNNNR